MAPVVTILGPIGSGKSKQAALLSRKLGWERVSSGELIRDSGRKDIQELVNQGKPAPTKFTEDLIMSKVKAISPQSGIILDGTHRLAEEADYFDQEFPKLGRELDLVVVIDLDETEIRRRLSLRAREDDHPEAIQTRLAWYKRDILPIIKRYEAQAKVRHVDGSGTPEEVQRRILDCLAEAGLTREV